MHEAWATWDVLGDMHNVCGGGGGGAMLGRKTLFHAMEKAMSEPTFDPIRLAIPPIIPHGHSLGSNLKGSTCLCLLLLLLEAVDKHFEQPLPDAVVCMAMKGLNVQCVCLVHVKLSSGSGYRAAKGKSREIGVA